ncbi:hypothetical protein GQ42DRAFT_164856 [Ramicandelaber brevisporus]|nr:hypothetical protein GQ42DRAFT_164856 [Ramicandelaber brevisporus]
MRNNDEHEQRDELQQQQLQWPTLPLLYLPIELAEETSLYFGGRTAARLLRVSRSFYSLFLPRVWVDLDTFTVIRDTEMKRHMLEKYGHFVRIINLAYYKVDRFKFDWLPFVKHATHLGTGTYSETTVDVAEALMKLIGQSEMLRTLNLRFDKYEPHLKLDELAAAINGLNYLECIICDFGHIYDPDDETGYEWRRVVSFVDLLRSSKRSKLTLKMSLYRAVNEVDVRTLAPYIAELRKYGDGICTTGLAHELFGVRDKDGQQLVFPQLKELKMGSCYFNLKLYDVKSITANRLPQLERLHFRFGSFDVLNSGESNENEHEVHYWKSGHSGFAHIIVPSQRWQYLTELQIGYIPSSILMDTISLCPQLQRLNTRVGISEIPAENNASRYNHDEVQLDAIMDRLPYLVYFTIGGQHSRLAVDPAAIPVKRRYDIDITITSHMSIAPSAAVYILQMPQLTKLTFDSCVFADVDETIQLLRGSAGACGVKEFHWRTTVWNQDLALAMTEKMPQLERFYGYKCPEEQRDAFKVTCMSSLFS